LFVSNDPLTVKKIKEITGLEKNRIKNINSILILKNL